MNSQAPLRRHTLRVRTLRLAWRVALALPVVLLGALLPAQGAPARARSIVYGVVFDSVAGRPLPQALVQLVSADTSVEQGRTVVADTAGRFSFDELPAGRYTIGFFHPLLDSLGLEPPLRAVSAAGTGAVRADLAIPSPRTIRAAICGAPTAQGSGAVVMGTIREAGTRASAAGVSVVAEWLELSFGSGGMNRRTPRRVTTTRDGGWFAICHVPSPGSLTLMASRGADSTAIVQTEVPATGFLRRDLYLGAARVAMAAVARDSAARDSAGGPTATPGRRVYLGDGRVQGVVLAAGTARPLAGAQIRIVDGPQTRTNARGEWTIANAPTGTRLLEVRAVGYYPERRALDVIDSAPPVRTALATFQSVLDTMKVSADRTVNTNLIGFQERRRSGVGRFLTPADVAARMPMATSELFRSVPGLFLDRTMDIDEKIMMRGIFEERCEPAVYLNGGWLNGVTAMEIDGYVRPADIAGIEVYAAGQVPAQFQPGLTGCGSIVFWTK
ncbi:MAG: carboxypeptidase regulatory-like domain-containing protein [Gemmatimonadota bacterium]|nr:carboxypeptidase regulatory-like domain-containing protein [Gemmatimonadota bacterium]